MQEHTIDPLSEDLEQVRELVKELPKGARPSPATVWRWTRKGARGTKLHTIKVCGKLLTTREEFRRFIAAIQEPQHSEPEHPETVNSELERLGYLPKKECNA